MQMNEGQSLQTTAGRSWWPKQKVHSLMLCHEDLSASGCTLRCCCNSALEHKAGQVRCDIRK